MYRPVARVAALLALSLSGGAIAQTPARGPAPPPVSAPSSPVADTVWQPGQAGATAPAARNEPPGERTDAGPRDGAPGQAHETHGTPNPRNPDPR